MKNFSKFILAAVVAVAAVVPASAQFRFGLKAGVALNNLKFDEQIISSSNRAGFTGGAMIEFTMPIVGFGVDASVLYATRSMDITEGENNTTKTRSYIDIPVNLKWKINVPAVGTFVKPYLLAGPDFSFLCSKKDAEAFIKSKSFDFAVNVGGGLEFVNHLQLGVTYGFPMGKQVSYDINGNGLYHGKNRCWTVTLAYLF